MQQMKAAISAGMTLRKRFTVRQDIQQKILPVTTAEYGLSKAARPFNSRLEKSKLVEAWIQTIANLAGCVEPLSERNRKIETKWELSVMGQITVEKNVGGIEGLCVITPAVHGDATRILHGNLQ